METSKNDEICVFTLIFITVSTTSVDVVCSALQHVHVFDDDDGNFRSARPRCFEADFGSGCGPFSVSYF